MLRVPANWENLAEIFASQYMKFPLRSIRESGNLHEPLSLSDIASRQEFERLYLYQDYYRVLGVSDDLSVNFGNPGHWVCLSGLRASGGFSAQVPTILSSLRIPTES